MLAVAEPGATFLLNSPYPAGRGLGRAAARGAGADHRQAAASSTWSTAWRWRSEAGMGGRINTVMQTCFFALAGILPRDEAIAGSRRRSRRPTASAARSCCRGTSPPSTARSAPSTRWPVPDRATSVTRLAPADRRRRPRLRQAGDADDDRGQGRPAAGQRAAGRRHLPDGDGQLREAEHRPGDPDLGPGHLHPVRPLRPGLPARRDPHEGRSTRRPLATAPASVPVAAVEAARSCPATG